MSSFHNVFAELRRRMVESAPNKIVAADEPGNLVLHTSEPEPATGKPVLFGAVTIKKNYVAYHLFPLYTHPGLGAGMSDALSRRRQGKSCFNFKAVDAELFAELAELTRRCGREDEPTA